MIRLYLAGGLGNQMFQYAAGYALARRHGTDLCLDLSEFARYELRDYMLDRYVLSGQVILSEKTPFLPVRLQKLLPLGNSYFEPHYHFDPHFFRCGPDAQIQGYFQSAKYFENAAEDIRACFKLKTPLSGSATEFLKRIEQAPVAVSLHVRRGDYVSDAHTQKVHGNLTEDYYRRAVSLIQALYGGQMEFFIFSDDATHAEEIFGFCKNRQIVQGLDPHEDMHLMSRCAHHIIANSSFSWWGAWLNQAADKTVIAPRLWFSRATLLKKSAVDLFPDGWILL